jgi:hypothetical protein
MVDVRRGAANHLCARSDIYRLTSTFYLRVPSWLDRAWLDRAAAAESLGIKSGLAPPTSAVTRTECAGPPLLHLGDV